MESQNGVDGEFAYLQSEIANRPIKPWLKGVAKLRLLLLYFLDPFNFRFYKLNQAFAS